MLDQKWGDQTWVAFDTETSGKYPLQAEICEIGAVKWRQGQIVDQFQTLVKPKNQMSAEVIAIHNITNEMVKDSPFIEEVIGDFRKFIEGAAIVAHHAPFDLGFLSYDMERMGLTLPSNFITCSSLLSRAIFKDSPNHKLRTLVDFFEIPNQTFHRAMDDAKNCLEVTLRCLEKMGPETTNKDIQEAMGNTLSWERFSLNALREDEIAGVVVSALETKKNLEFKYKNKQRRVFPQGLVRSLNGDYLVAHDMGGDETAIAKRFIISKISKPRRLV